MLVSVSMILGKLNEMSEMFEKGVRLSIKLSFFDLLSILSLGIVFLLDVCLFETLFAVHIFNYYGAGCIVMHFS